MGILSGNAAGNDSFDPAGITSVKGTAESPGDLLATVPLRCSCTILRNVLMTPLVETPGFRCLGRQALGKRHLVEWGVKEAEELLSSDAHFLRAQLRPRGVLDFPYVHVPPSLKLRLNLISRRCSNYLN